MLDLVLWSWLLALTPWAVWLALKLISGVAGLISPEVPYGSVAVPRGPVHPEALCDGSRRGNGRKFSCDPMIN
jgi:hypothetical protein